MIPVENISTTDLRKGSLRHFSIYQLQTFKTPKIMKLQICLYYDGNVLELGVIKRANVSIYIQSFFYKLCCCGNS